MAVVAFNQGARDGVAAAEIVNGRGYVLIVRIADDPSGGFEVGFEEPGDAAQVKATAKDAAPPELAAAIDAAFAVAFP